MMTGAPTWTYGCAAVVETQPPPTFNDADAAVNASVALITVLETTSLILIIFLLS